MNACLALDLILVIHESYGNGKKSFHLYKITALIIQCSVDTLQMDGVLYSDNQLR